MDEPGSISRCLDELRQGNRTAVEVLWCRYMRRTEGLARLYLRDGSRRVADEQDAACVAFTALCRRLESGGLPDVQNRDDLWRYLAKLVRRSAARQQRDLERLKRGGGIARAELNAVGSLSDPRDGLPQVADSRPMAFDADFDDCCQQMLDLLPTDELRELALSKLEGYTHEEIAAQRRLSVRTIERKVARIRLHWRELIDD